MSVLSEQRARESTIWETAPEAGRSDACIGPECRGGWMDWLRPRAHVWLDDRRLCSQACVEVFVGQMLRRYSTASAMQATPHRHRIPIGLVMLAQGWITPEQLQCALSEQRITREQTGIAGRIGYFLDRHGAAGEDVITRALGLQWNCPVFDLRNPAQRNTAWMPPVLATKYRCLPLRQGPQGALLLAFDGVLDAQCVYAVQHMNGVDVVPGLLAESKFHHALAEYGSADAPRVDEWNTTGATTARRLSRWVWQDSGAELRSVVLHKHLWLRNLRRNHDLVLPLAD